MELDNPRQIAREAIKASVPALLWSQNKNFVASLRKSLQHHSFVSHPVINALNKGVFGKKEMKRVHLEFRYAGVQPFTDALLMAQYLSYQLEPRLTSGSKMYARFLLTLNVLDEFGFQPGIDRYGYYRGNPNAAHYPLFERVLDELEVSSDERLRYVPTEATVRAKKFLENAYTDLNSVVSFLAVAEQVVILIAKPLRENARAVGINVNSGYYFCHGISEDMDTNANDDNHENDLWWVLMQAITPDRYDDVAERCIQYLSLWAEFWDEQMRVLDKTTLCYLNLAKALV